MLDCRGTDWGYDSFEGGFRAAIEFPEADLTKS
jgi:hypothetical protein